MKEYYKNVYFNPVSQGLNFGPNKFETREAAAKTTSPNIVAIVKLRETTTLEVVQEPQQVPQFVERRKGKGCRRIMKTNSTGYTRRAGGPIDRRKGAQ